MGSYSPSGEQIACGRDVWDCSSNRLRSLDSLAERRNNPFDACFSWKRMEQYS
jgi:iron-sulfur cluster repair protein YtfE (RIC family)